jgi:hypothetical protein
VRPPENQPEIKVRGGRIVINTADINSDVNKQDNIENEQKIESIFFEKLEAEIIEMVKDVTATNMHDIMKRIEGSEDAITHIIEIKPGTEPIKQKSRKIPQSFKAGFKTMLNEMKDAGMIVDSKSPWCSPVRLVRKPDGSIRVCVDFRKLNNVTVKDSFPMQKIEEIFQQLATARIFSSIDLAQGYFQIKMDPASMAYTAFATEHDFFEYKVMPMGLTNACATFQRGMHKVLGGYLGIFCVVYLDDILIFSSNPQDHKRHVELVIERLRKYNLKIKLSKCKFARSRIEYLSHIVENGTISPNPAKVAAVSEAKRPTTVKTVQSFIGLVSYYRRFIKNCSTIMAPLIKLTEKDSPFIWSEECETAFQKLKSYLSTENKVLALPDFEKQFRIEADASKIGLGAVISQKNGRHWQPVSYFSKILTKTERNYSTSEREMLAIVLAVEHFKEYIYGREFIILTDHEPLKFMSSTDAPAPRLARLQKRLNIYDFTIQYRPGKLNGGADALSRMFDDDESLIEVGEEDKTVVINAIHLKTNGHSKEQLGDEDINWIFQLKKTQKRRPIIENFRNKECESLYKQWDSLLILNNNLYREYMDALDVTHYQFVVPKSQRKLVLEKNHDSAVCGHLGFEKTRDRIMHRFYWYKYIEAIKGYVDSCEKCQINKSTNQYNKADMKPIYATRPGQIVVTDIMGPIPTSGGKFKYILTVSDHFTKYVEFFAMESTSAEETARKVMEYVCRHGVMESLLSDRGTNYQSRLMQELLEQLDIHQLRTTSFHPVCNGQSERLNRSVQAMLANYLNEEKDNWEQFLPYMQFSYNTAIHSTTKFSPFELTYGRTPKIPIDLIVPSESLDLYLDEASYASGVKDNLSRAFEMVAKNTESRMEKAKLRHDRDVVAANFEVGDFVWVHDTTTKKGKCKNKNLSYKYFYKTLGIST